MCTPQGDDQEKSQRHWASDTFRRHVDGLIRYLPHCTECGRLSPRCFLVTCVIGSIWRQELFSKKQLQDDVIVKLSLTESPLSLHPQ